MAMFKLDSKHWRQKPEDVFVLFSWRAHGGVKEVFPQEFMLLIFLFFEKNTCAVILTTTVHSFHILSWREIVVTKYFLVTERKAGGPSTCFVKIFTCLPPLYQSSFFLFFAKSLKASESHRSLLNTGNSHTPNTAD